MREDFGNLQMNNQFDADDNFSGNAGLESAEASELLRDDHEMNDVSPALSVGCVAFGLIHRLKM